MLYTDPSKTGSSNIALRKQNAKKFHKEYNQQVEYLLQHEARVMKTDPDFAVNVYYVDEDHLRIANKEFRYVYALLAISF